MDYKSDYHGESDADDEYERSIAEQSPTLMADEGSSHAGSDGTMSNQHTPTRYSHGGASAILSPTGLITKWTADQCADYIASLGLEQYADALVDEAIDGEALIAMQHEDLKDVGIASIGHRLTILKNVYDLKRQQNVEIEPDHYVPLSADANAPDAHATQDDIARIINQIKLRDERLKTVEADLRTMRETLDRVFDEQRRLREDTLPLVRMAKDRSQPLPTPEGATPTSDPLGSPRSATQDNRAPTSGNGLSRKFSNKKLHLGGGIKMPSPTIHESSSLDPSAAAMAASSHLTDSMRSVPQQSPHGSQQTSPTSPQYNFQTSITSRSFSRQDSGHTQTEQPWTYSNASTVVGERDRDQRPSLSAPAATRRPQTANAQSVSSPDDYQHPSPATSTRPPPQQAGPQGSQQQQGSSSDAPMEFMKSFRVSMEEPCHKVLPVALKKYHINDDWRQYSLYIVHGDQERCLGLEERPLILFKQLASEGKKPMFMLRKHAAPEHGFTHRHYSQAEAPPPSRGGQPVSAPNMLTQQPSFAPGGPTSMASNSGRVHSYAPSMQLPGGVL